MWIFRWVISAILILLILFFAFENQSQLVSVKFLKWQTPNLPLYLFLYIAFGAGLLFWVFISTINMFKLRSEIHRLNRDNQKIKAELGRLRNVSIEDDDDHWESDEEKTPRESEPTN